MQDDDPPDDQARLPRVLGPVEALCVVVGSVIGSGIFIVPARVAREVPALGGIVLAWVVGGLFSLAGALTLSELSAMLPRAGGPYVYLKRAYGPAMAFLFGWTEFLVIRAGSMATLAAAFALYFSQVVPAPSGVAPGAWEMVVAVGVMAAVAAVNIAGTKLGGGVQVVGTALKVAALGGMIVLPFLLGAAHVDNLRSVGPSPAQPGLVAGFAAAMVGVLWAYDGWINTSELAEEVRDPGRNLPRALIGGMVLLIALYVGMTLVYHLVLPMAEVASAATEKGSPRVVAAVFMTALLGRPGQVAIALVVMGSTLISLNGNALCGPRAYFAMARDGLFPAPLGRVHPRTQTPANAIAAQAGWAIVLTVAATVPVLAAPPEEGSSLPESIQSAWTTLHARPLYDIMYSYVIFGATSIYLLTITSVFVLRLREPGLARPYRTWGYPATPLLFVVAALLLLGSMLVSSPVESAAGLGILLAGLPAYLVVRRGGAAVEP